MRRGRYRTYAITFDMEGRSEGDYQNFQRGVNDVEASNPGTLLLGQAETLSYPRLVVRETLAAPTPAEP